MEQAKRQETQVRLRLLKNVAAPGGPCGQIGEVVYADAEMAQSLIEAGAAIEIDFSEPPKEERDTATSPQPSPKGEGAKPARKSVTVVNPKGAK